MVSGTIQGPENSCQDLYQQRAVDKAVPELNTADLSEGISVVQLQQRMAPSVYQCCFYARELFSERHCALGF